jgi:hypothetical protein
MSSRMAFVFAYAMLTLSFSGLRVFVRSSCYPWCDEADFDNSQGFEEHQEVVLQKARKLFSERLPQVYPETFRKATDLDTTATSIGIFVRKFDGQLLEATLSTTAAVVKPALALEQTELYKITALIKSLTGVCALMSIGYWNYEWCFGRMVSQFHLDHQDNKLIRSPDWSLGRFSHQHVVYSQHAEEGHDFPYIVKLVEHYKDGQRCDETGRGRSTEVHIQCCENAPV